MNTQKLRQHQVDKHLEPFRQLARRRVPTGGWLKTIRLALGLTLRQQAKRCNIAFPTLHSTEHSEAEDRITLGQLRKMAAALDCELVYALVPSKPLSEITETQAEKIAQEEVFSVAHSMALENQRPTDTFLAEQIESRKRELLTGKWSKLWG
ncbi:mobile mystery protein A [Sulfurirhabdus autotrophica]|uniref:Putative DNA-binding mobile mystery protein A n=1 Tax=Sulfurirhabdus autotrophica TaxID=1706046 RepID=A0A4R3XWC2_9PROT|nr:mobile mystery protein A [Sulfurirhabdus autotrophica]TCV81069.1 putative DNA-binding mobile mystery protein A [Sulfurirhabdus autotrophica]